MDKQEAGRTPILTLLLVIQGNFQRFQCMATSLTKVQISQVERCEKVQISIDQTHVDIRIASAKGFDLIP